MPKFPHTPLRILLIDDHTIFRAGVRMLIETHTGMNVAGEAGNQTDALTLAASLHPDVLLLDLDLDGTINLGFIPNLLAAAGGGQILILTGVHDSDLYRQALESGARGIVLKDKAVKSLLDAILAVGQGELWIDHTT